MEKKRNKKGFTMVELMAVLVIIGLLATLVGTQVLKQIEQARVATTKANLKTLDAAVSQFYMELGQLPSEEMGLNALVEAPPGLEEKWTGYLRENEIPKDGWKREFKFETVPGTLHGFVIRSSGPDGEFDTDDDLLSTDAD